MEIEWESEKDHRIVFELAKKDPVTARRMERIAAAITFLDLVPGANGRAHFLDRDYVGYFALDLSTKLNPARLICIPTGDYQKNGNLYKKETITSFKIVKIEKNYH